jgi:hypothetical protein
MIAEHGTSALRAIAGEARTLALAAEQIGEPFLVYLIRMVEEEALGLAARRPRAPAPLPEQPSTSQGPELVG